MGLIGDCSLQKKESVNPTDEQKYSKLNNKERGDWEQGSHDSLSCRLQQIVQSKSP